jgi:hypothetical protein
MTAHLQEEFSVVQRPEIAGQCANVGVFEFLRERRYLAFDVGPMIIGVAAYSIAISSLPLLPLGLPRRRQLGFCV